MFKRLPNKIRIRKKTYSVTYQDEVDKGRSYGSVDFPTQKILIATKNIPESEIESTIIHEVIHAIANEYDLRLGEPTVLKLERGLFEVFRRNGWRIKGKIS